MAFRDALRRHEQVHIEPKRSVLGKGYRACLACAAGRRKCSGGTPCLGCQKRTAECKYPESGRASRATSKLPLAREEGASPAEDHATPSGSEHSPSKVQESPMSWSNTSASPRMNQDHDQINTATADSLPGTNDQNTFHFQGHPSTEYSLSFVQNTVPLQNAISPGLSAVNNSQPLTSSTSRRQPQNMEIRPSSESIQPFMEQSTNAGPLNMNSVADMGHTQHENEIPEPWYQNNFSSINWLPDNWTPDFQMDGNLGPFDQHSLFFGQTPQANNMTYSLGSSDQNQTSPLQLSRARDLLRRQSEVVDQDVSSPSTQSTHSGGHFYVDGDGARLPRVRKIPYRHSDSYTHAPTFGSEELFPAFNFPETGDLIEVAEPKQIPQSSYNEIIECFTHTCSTTSHYVKFYDSVFPSRNILSRCIQLYRDNFEAILPFIHPATFDISTSHWLLILAMAAVGSHYLEIEQSNDFSVAIHEYLRRALETLVSSPILFFQHLSSNLTQAETGKHPGLSKLLLTQIKVLNSVGMSYCGDERLSIIARNYHGDLASFCTTEWLMPYLEAEPSSLNGMDDGDYGWRKWYEAESRRRTGYCIWVSFQLHLDVRAHNSTVVRLYVGIPFSNTPSSVPGGCSGSYTMSRSSLGGTDSSRLATTASLC
jgi:hypothetical protein